MLSERFWKFESLLRLGILVLGSVGLGVLFAYFATQALVAARINLDPEFVAQVIGFLSIHGLAVLWVSMFLAEHDLTWAEAFGFRCAPGRSIGTALVTMIFAWPLATLVIAMLVAMALKWMGWDPELQVTVSFIKRNPPTWQLAVTGFTAIVLAPIAEETLFRGILYTTLKQRGFRHLAWWGNAVLFGIIHTNVTALLPMVFLGLVWTWLYERTGNLLAPMVGHMMFNAISFVLITTHTPEWLEKALNP